MMNNRLEYQRNYYKNQPWKRILENIKKRCQNPKNDHYKWYGKKGIECKITEEEVKTLWFRDKAYLMVKPSIDRKKSNKNYTLDNCQFIEHKENSVKDKRKIVLQYDLNENFIREWRSTADVTKKLGFSHIVDCCNFKRKTANKFIWRYKNG